MKLLDGLVLDLKAIVRSLRGRPAFTLTTIATLALGIGATTAVFSLVNSVLLRPLPFAHADRLAAIWPRQFVANREIDYLRSHASSYDEVAGFSPGWLMALTGVDIPRQLNAGRVSGNMFSMVGAQPILGGVFGMEAEVPGQTLVAVLGWETWQSVFAGDSAIVGRSISLEGRSYTVVGVMPHGFQLFDWKSDLWTPLGMNRQDFTWNGATSHVYGRLRSGRTVERANAEIPVLARAMQAEFQHPADWVRDAHVVDLRDHLVGGVQRMLWFLFGAVGFLLLIAAANVANLVLVRTAERRHELALRRSLGAPVARIARLLLAESFVLAAVGGVVAVGVAALAVRFLPALLPPDLPRIAEIGLDARVFGFALAATLLPAFALGVAPVAFAGRQGTAATLREARTGSRAGERTRGVLVAFEVALALVLLVGATLMTRTLTSLMNVDPGLETDRLLTATVQPTGMRDQEELRAFWRETIARIEAVPGVVSAGTILHLPTSGRSWNANIEIEGRPRPTGESAPRAGWQSVSTKYFATAGVRLIAGRTFEEVDRADAPRVVIVNSALAEQLFRGESPIGRRINTGASTQNEWATIVGVVGSVRHDSLNLPPAPELYVPFEQVTVWANSIVVRTSGEPIAVAPAVRDRIWSVNRNTPITSMRSMRDMLSASLHRPRLILTVLALFAALGLGLGAVGIYGVVAFGVQQRTRELGIRAALGADGASLNRLVVRSGVGLALAGVALGLPVALVLTRFVRGFVFGVAPTDLVSFTVVPIVLVTIAALASWLPARRAGRADPMAVLRQE